MTLSFVARWIAVWVAAALSQCSRGQALDCNRVWDMSPISTRPAGKTHEQWYGSPALDCVDDDGIHSRIYCIGDNC